MQRVVATAAPPAADVVDMLLDTAELEMSMKSVYAALLEGKEGRWEKSKGEAVGRMTELAEFYAGSKVLSRNVKDDNLKSWFEHIAEEVRKLDFAQPLSAGRKIHQLVSALTDVEQFHQVYPKP